MKVKRCLVYILGLFVIALGVSLSVHAGLGISPMSSAPYLIHRITGLNMSITMTLVYGIYVGLEAYFLGKEAKASIILQIGVAFILGFFVDITKYLTRGLVFQNLGARLALVILGALVLSMGVSLYIKMDLVPLPAEGLAGAIHKKYKNLEFYKCKKLVDISSVIIAIIVSLAYYKKLVGVGIGTIIGAYLVGQSLPLMNKINKKLVDWALA